MPSPHRLTWELHTRADIAATWACLSDTDRFNRLAGLGFTFEPAPPGAEVRRIGRMRRLGMELSWDELPFQYEAPRWFRTRRVFHGGPASEFTAQLRLKEAADGGTDILYSVEVTPRNILTSPVVKIDLERSTRPQLESVFDILIEELDHSHTPREQAPPPLTLEQEARLSKGLATLGQGPDAEQLGELIRHGALLDQHRMAPPTLAQRWSLPLEQVTSLLLSATERGLLAIHWEILCPSCRAPQGPMGARELHCPSCEIPFDGALPDSVAVFFRPAKAIRDFEVPQDCVGSPALTRHILASRALPAGETIAMEVNLSAGPYRVRTWPMRGTASLEVRESAPPTSLELQVATSEITPPLLRAEPGAVTLQLHNTTDKPVRVVLESSWRPEGNMTAGQMLERFPRASNFLPVGLAVAQARSEARTVLALVRDTAGDGRAMAHYLKAGGADTVLLSRGGALALFTDPQDALRALRALPNPGSLRAGLSQGPVLMLQTPNGERPAGQIAQAAMHAARSVALGHLAMSQDNDALSLAISELGWTSIVPWYQRRQDTLQWYPLTG